VTTKFIRILLKFQTKKCADVIFGAFLFLEKYLTPVAQMREDAKILSA